MKKYKAPEFEVIRFLSEEIATDGETTSAGVDPGSQGGQQATD